MTKAEFLSDDRYCRLSADDIARAGGDRERAIARLLDRASSTAFAAVLDRGVVWTSLTDDGAQVIGEDGLPVIQWEWLEDFE